MKLVSIALLLLIGCGQSKQEKLQAALNEVERLKALKEKTAELVVQQRTNMLSEAEKYDSYVWVKAEKKKSFLLKLRQKKKSLNTGQNWHAKEKKEYFRLWKIGSWLHGNEG